VSPVRYELGFSISEDDILHSHFRENLKCFKVDRTFVVCIRSASNSVPGAGVQMSTAL
jgi:hypothetical protein